MGAGHLAPDTLLLPPPSFAELLGRVPATPRPERFIVMLFKETSLLLTAFALSACSCAPWRAAPEPARVRSSPPCCAWRSLVVSLVPGGAGVRRPPPPRACRSLSRGISPTCPRSRSASRTVLQRPCRTPAREERSSRSTSGEPPGGDGGGPGRRSGPGAAAEGRPAVIVVHGGGWRSGERSDFPSWDAWLADEGYVVFDIDYRLSPPPSWQDAPADVACAVGWVKENAGPLRRGPRTGRPHGPLGGRPTRPAHGLHGGPCRPRARLRRPRRQGHRGRGGGGLLPAHRPLAPLVQAGYLGGMDRFLGGSRRAVPGRYRQLSPVSHVDPGDPPTFLAYGGGDRIVPPGSPSCCESGCGRPACPIASSSCRGPTTPSTSSGEAGAPRSPAPRSRTF